MKFFKLKYGEEKEKVIRLSSIEFLNMVASKTPIWQQSMGSNRRKSIANETKRECWREIARKLVGRAYLDAKVKDRLEIEQGLKSRFHAMRDQWVKCRNRNKLYAFEDQIKFLDSKQHLTSVEYKFDFESESNTSKMFIVSEDVKSQHTEDYEEIEHTSITAEDNVEMEEEHIQIEIANSTPGAVYIDDGNIVTEFPRSSPPPMCLQSPESSEPTHIAESPAPSPSSPSPSPVSQSHCRKLDHRPDSSMSYSCGCHCHRDEAELKHRENVLFGKAIATLLNNMDGEKLFETKKAILSCIVRDIFIVDPNASTSSSAANATKK